MKNAFVTLIILLILVSCISPAPVDVPLRSKTSVETSQSTNSSITESNVPPTYTPSPTILPSASPTPLPTASETSTLSPSASPTETPDEWQLTMQAVPAYTPATAVPIPEDNKFNNDLIDLGFQLLDVSSIIGPDGYTYSAYLFYKDHIFSEWECRVAFYRAEGEDNFLLSSFPHPRYNVEGRWDNLPAACIPANWNEPIHNLLYFSYPQDQATYLDLNLHGPWSDINQNGLPEFSVIYDFCPNACWDEGAISIHFYEIRTTSKIVDLTLNLPGAIEPFHFIHSKNPYTFYVYDPSLSHWYCSGCIYNTFWIYGWDGKELVDVTEQYQDEYLARGQEIIQNIQASYGKSIPEWWLLEILFLYDKAGLRKQALQDFMEISDPVHWPKTHQWHTCWLQIARASAQENYRLGKSFGFPPLNLTNLYFPEKELAYALDKVNPTRYDVSVCQALMKTLTP